MILRHDLPVGQADRLEVLAQVLGLGLGAHLAELTELLLLSNGLLLRWDPQLLLGCGARVGTAEWVEPRCELVEAIQKGLEKRA